MSVAAMNETTAMEVDSSSNDNAAKNNHKERLPDNRFAMELEFVQSLASPAYWHFLATYRDENGILTLKDPAFCRFLRYLYKTWSQPEYARFLQYPHALYWIPLFLEHQTNESTNRMAKEWTMVQFRDFAHQQQFHAWQHRNVSLYGRGTRTEESVPTAENAEQATIEETSAMETNTS